MLILWSAATPGPSCPLRSLQDLRSAASQREVSPALAHRPPQCWQAPPLKYLLRCLKDSLGPLLVTSGRGLSQLKAQSGVMSWLCCARLLP